MDINDYLIDQEGKDWETLLMPWYWRLPDNFSLWMVNMMGDLIFVTEDETVHFLDVGSGRFEQIAENQEDFVEKVNEGENADMWLAISLVDECQEAGLSISESECFGYKQPPVLGGAYDVDNIEPTDLVVHYSITGQIHEQIKDVPDGASVDIKIVPPGQPEES